MGMSIMGFGNPVFERAALASTRRQANSCNPATILKTKKMQAILFITKNLTGYPTASRYTPIWMLHDFSGILG
jgi:hypothetical protein